MTRQELQTEWLKAYCPTCANNEDRGTHYIESTVPTSAEGATILRGVPQKELVQRERALSAARTARRDIKAVMMNEQQGNDREGR